ncbi:hypothetical protein BURCENBC7_AP7107 [Burkholderia cenocepacia BC7]|nr:hypothetical protein BURCENBC7_AP7107 [Burkholderia cenocepacia BC7]
MPRPASAGAAFSFSLHAHRRAPFGLSRPVFPARRHDAATWCGNSPRFLL